MREHDVKARAYSQANQDALQLRAMCLY
jgi:hypothetical protein